MVRKERCNSLLAKADHNLRQALLGARWKDVLLVPQEWYPEYTPRYETKRWWYVPAEAVLGRACKSCNAFCELADFVGAKRQRTVSVICYKCNLEENRTDTPGGYKRAALTLDGGSFRRSDRVQGRGRVDYQEDSLESETQNDSDDNGSNKQLSYGLKLRAADPRYITNGDDSNRGDMLLTMAQVRELITKKEQSEEGIATV
jgi:hypothetical protein